MGVLSNTRQSVGSLTVASEMASSAQGTKSTEASQRASIRAALTPSRTTNSTAFKLGKAIISTHVDGFDDLGDDNSSSDDSDSDDDEHVGKMQDRDEALSKEDQRELRALKGTPDKGMQSKAAADKTASTKAPVSKSTTTPEVQPTSPAAKSAGPNVNKTEVAPTNKAAAPKSKLTSTTTRVKTESSVQARAELSPAAPVITSTETGPSTAVKPSAPTKPNPLAPTPAAPHGYKIVKVKKPDGTVAKVKRPLKEGEIPLVDPTKPVPSMNKSDAEPKKSDAIPKTNKATLGPIVVVDFDKNSPPKIEVSDVSEKPAIAAEHAALAEKLSSNTKALSEREMDAPHHIQVTEKEIEQGDAQSAIIRAEHQTQLEPAHKVFRLVKICAWSVAVLFPLFFLALGVATALLNNHVVPRSHLFLAPTKTSSSSRKTTNNDPLSQAITVAASAWPIIFAAVVAQSLKMYAAYKVERGVKLMTLEQLTSSHSVGGALKQPFMLRTFNWTSVFLLILWALSPLAGQSILRMSNTYEDWETVDVNSSYYSTVTQLKYGNGFNLTTAWWEGSEGYAGSVDSSYSYQVEFSLCTALMQGYSQGYLNPQDIYQNVKIPLLGRVNGSNTYEPNVETQYSSLLGFPYWIYSYSAPNASYEDQTNSFKVSTRYFALNCSQPTVVSANADILRVRNLTGLEYGVKTMAVSAMNNTQSPLDGPMYWNGTFYIPADDLYYNGTNYIAGSDIGIDKVSNSTYGLNLTTTYMQPGPTGTLYFASLKKINDDDVITDVLYAECPYSSVRLDTLLLCNGVAQNATCSAQEQWEVTESASNSTALPLGYIFPSVLQRLGASPDYGLSELELFLNDTLYASKQTHSNSGGSGSNSNYQTIPSGEQFSQRLGLVLNALWDLGLYETAPFTGPDVASWREYDFAYENMTNTAYGTPFERYWVVWGWLSCLIICSVLLLVAAVAAAIFETRTVGPEFLGFANTAIKKNVKTPKHISAMNARDRLAALQECEVILHDAKPNAAVGKIQLGVREEGQVRLVKTRQYK